MSHNSFDWTIHYLLLTANLCSAIACWFLQSAQLKQQCVVCISHVVFLLDSFIGILTGMLLLLLLLLQLLLMPC